MLAAAGSSAAQVPQLRVCVRGKLADLIRAITRHFGAVRPVLTGVWVSLASCDTLIEIEVVARRHPPSALQ